MKGQVPGLEQLWVEPTLSPAAPPPPPLLMHAQAPGLEDLSVEGAVDLRSGPWEALGRLAHVGSLMVKDVWGTGAHEAYAAALRPRPVQQQQQAQQGGGGRGPSKGQGGRQDGEEGARAGAARRSGRLLALPGGRAGKEAGSGAGGGWDGDGAAGCGAAAAAAAEAAGGGGGDQAGPPQLHPAFDVRWLPPRLAWCSVRLPKGTRVLGAQGPAQGGGGNAVAGGSAGAAGVAGAADGVNGRPSGSNGPRRPEQAQEQGQRGEAGRVRAEEQRPWLARLQVREVEGAVELELAEG